MLSNICTVLVKGRGFYPTSIDLTRYLKHRATDLSNIFLWTRCSPGNLETYNPSFFGYKKKKKCGQDRDVPECAGPSKRLNDYCWEKHFPFQRGEIRRRTAVLSPRCSGPNGHSVTDIKEPRGRGREKKEKKEPARREHRGDTTAAADFTRTMFWKHARS